MKILLLSKKFPYPLRDGESQAIHGLSKSLSELGADVYLLAMNTNKHFFEGKSLPKEMSHFKGVRTVPINTDLKYGAALKNLVKGISYHISRFDSPVYHAALANWLQKEEFDVIQLETLYLAPYIPTIRRHSKALVAMRAHNVEFEIWQRVCDNVAFRPKRWYLRHLTQQLRRYETARLLDYDLLLAITDRDDANFRQLGFEGKSSVVPIGLDTCSQGPDYRVYHRPPSLSFIGSLDWAPNLEGLEWFLNNVWPKLHQKYPDLQFHVAGRNMPVSMQKKEGQNVVVHGEVEDAATFVNQHGISIVPLLSGSGMRAKILEAMSLGRTVVTTTVGVEGIEATHGKEVMVADTPDQFFTQICNCLDNYRQMEKIGRAAETTFSEKYCRLHIAERVLQTYHEQINQPLSV